MMVDTVKEKFSSIVSKLDQDENQEISWEEFQKILDYPEAIDALEAVQVDPIGMIDMAEDLFTQEDGQKKYLKFDQFMELVLDHRGAQQAAVKDIMNLGNRINRKFREVNCKVDKEFGQVNNKIDAVQ